MPTRHVRGCEPQSLNAKQAQRRRRTRARHGSSSLEMLVVIALVALGLVTALRTLGIELANGAERVSAAIESLIGLHPRALERGQVAQTPASPSAAPAERAPRASAAASGGEEGLGTGGKVLVGLAGAATGVAVGIGATAGTAYLASLACGPAAPVCAGAVTLGLLGYAGYELYNGGFAQLRGAFGRVFSSQRASVADAFTVGATLGGIAYGAGASVGRGAALQRGLAARAARAGLEQRGAIAQRLALASATNGAVTNLGTRTVASNANLFARLAPGEGMSGVFDHATGRFILRPSTTAAPLPAGSVAQFGGHEAVRADLGAALGENLTSAASGRLSGFSLVKTSDGIRFGWNSGQVNNASHGARAVPESLRTEIEAAVRAALGL